MKDSVAAAVEKGVGKAKKSHKHRSRHKNFLISLSLDIFTRTKKEPESLRKDIVTESSLKTSLLYL